MTAKPGPPPPSDKNPFFDYAAAAEEIKALPRGHADDDEAAPPIPLELILKPAPIVPNAVFGLFALVLFLAVALWFVRGILEKRRWEAMAPEHAAMQGLLAVGSAQRAYASMSSVSRYGSPSELRRVGQVPIGFTPTSGIAGYSITFWSLGSPIWTNSGIRPASIAPGTPYRTRRLIAAASFTLVAIPLVPSPKLRTFALCEDGLLRTPAGPVSNYEGACDWPQIPAKERLKLNVDG